MVSNHEFILSNYCLESSIMAWIELSRIVLSTRGKGAVGIVVDSVYIATLDPDSVFL